MYYFEFYGVKKKYYLRIFRTEEKPYKKTYCAALSPPMRLKTVQYLRPAPSWDTCRYDINFSCFCL